MDCILTYNIGNFRLISFLIILNLHTSESPLCHIFHTRAFVEIVKLIGIDDWFKKTIYPPMISYGLSLFMKEKRIFLSPLSQVNSLEYFQSLQTSAEGRSLRYTSDRFIPGNTAENKTPNGEEAYNPSNLVCRAMTAVRECTDNIGIIADVALDPYTIHMVKMDSCAMALL